MQAAFLHIFASPSTQKRNINSGNFPETTPIIFLGFTIPIPFSQQLKRGGDMFNLHEPTSISQFLFVDNL
jgi:hypothetical protein